MNIVTHNRLIIYFGGKEDDVHVHSYDALKTDITLQSLPKARTLHTDFNVQRALFLHQEHTDQGVHITSSHDLEPELFVGTGDYLISTQRQLGLGVLAADCVPIIVYDAYAGIVAAIHAGWRGSVAGILVKVINQMRKIAGMHLDHIELFWGPHARACCYQVQSDVVQALPRHLIVQVAQYCNGRYTLNLQELNRYMLAQAGIYVKKHHDHAACTICDHRFFSYRRQGVVAGRQMTIAALL